MKMFIWTKSILPNYTDGIAVGVAETIEEARQQVLNKYAASYGHTQTEMEGDWKYDNLSTQLHQPPIEELFLPNACFMEGGS